MTNEDNDKPVQGSGISQERLVEIAAIKDEAIDFSDIPEQGEEFFKKARAYNRGVPVELGFALDAGFESYHTGGGLWALRKDVEGSEDDYLLITDGNEDLESAPDDAVWNVGRYTTVDDVEAWVFVREAVTLTQAIELAIQMPVPTKDQPEKAVEEWSDIDLTVSAPDNAGPRM
jgi:hypothetical protein